MSPLTRPVTLMLATLAPLAAAVAASDGFTDQFPIPACQFSTIGGNAFLKLQPGRQLYLNNERCLEAGDCDELVELWITVLPRTKVIHFFDSGRMRSVRARVLEEISHNYVASCEPMNDVYYFGEDVEDGARPGILRPDRAFLLGARYYQEIAVNAQDRGEHTSMGFEVEVTETTPLEPGHESLKTYCPNVGMVRDGDLELSAIYRNARSPSEDD